MFIYYYHHQKLIYKIIFKKYDLLQFFVINLKYMII